MGGVYDEHRCQEANQLFLYGTLATFFQYFDQASNSFKYLNAKPGEAAYEEFWITMLKSFAQHLKKKDGLRLLISLWMNVL